MLTKYTTGDFTLHGGTAGAPRHDKNPDLKLPKGEKLPKQGALYVGEGRMVPHCGIQPLSQVVASELDKEFKSVNHYTQFLDAIEGKDKTLAGFDYVALQPSLLSRSGCLPIPWQTTGMGRQENARH